MPTPATSLSGETLSPENRALIEADLGQTYWEPNDCYVWLSAATEGDLNRLLNAARSDSPTADQGSSEREGDEPSEPVAGVYDGWRGITQPCDVCGKLVAVNAVSPSECLCSEECGYKHYGINSTPSPVGEQEPVAWKPTHRHVKRGTAYQVVGEATLQWSTHCYGDIADDTPLTVYRGEDGKLWARPVPEFSDGRFRQIDQSLYAAPPAFPVMDSWSPIATAPKDGTRFLAYEKGDEAQQYVCWWQEDFGHWEGWQNVWDNEPEPTHWMPLSAPPVPDRQGDKTRSQSQPCADAQARSTADQHSGGEG